MIKLYLENKVGAFMKKRSLVLIIFMIGMFMLRCNVYAAEDRSCNASSLNELRTAAANVKVSYVPTTLHVDNDGNSTNGEDSTEAKYLDVKIYNVTEGLIVRVNASGNRVVDDEKIVTYRNVGPDGSITIRQPVQREMITYIFTIFSTSYGCVNKTLRTMKLTLPKFNYYSQLSICSDIPEYYLCQEFTTYKIDGSNFYDKVDEYKAKLLEQEEKGELIVDDNTSIISKAASAVSNHKFIIVGIIVLVGVIVTIVILKRKKSDL